MPKDDETWLNIGYMVFAVMVFFVAKSAIEMIGIQTAFSERYDWYAYLQTFGGLAIGAGSLFWAKSSSERHEYYLNSIAELRKVTWPTAPDVKRMTIVVCVVVAVFAVILSVFDMAWARVLKLLLA